MTISIIIDTFAGVLSGINMEVNLVIGSPVTDDDFFGRTEELQQAATLLRNHNNLILAAPRRVGKTSFAKKLQVQMQTEGWDVLYVDLEGVKDIEAFFKRLKKKLLENPSISKSTKVVDKIKQFLPGVNISAPIGGVNVSVDIKLHSDEYFSCLQDILLSLNNRLVIVLDELTVLLEQIMEDGGEKDAKAFLNQLRALRQETTKSCGWIICSSVGVRNFTSQHHVSATINDLYDFDLGPFAENEAMLFIQALSKSIHRNISEQVAQYIMHRTGWPLPYFIQLVLSEIRGTGDVSESDVDNAYERLIDSPFLEVWHERLSIEYGDNEEPAYQLLCYICVSPEGKEREKVHSYILSQFSSMKDDALRILIRSLVTDGYIYRKGDRLTFRSPLLRDYWKHNFCD